jgi:hypothetical protein
MVICNFLVGCLPSAELTGLIHCYFLQVQSTLIAFSNGRIVEMFFFSRQLKISLVIQLILLVVSSSIGSSRPTPELQRCYSEK